MIGETFVISRRAALAGALIFGFSSVGRTLAQEGGAATPHAPPLPGSLKRTPFLDSWIRVGADGNVTVLTGKAELGQGIKTALMQIAAEQLDVEFERLTLVTADTALTANEDYTTGSHSMQDSGTAILNAAAQVRQLLVAEAATRAGLPADQMRTDKGVVIAPDGKRFAYGELVGAQMLHVQASPQSPLKNPARFKVMQ
jgi:nicotinate dehydrogenase subunit B